MRIIEKTGDLFDAPGEFIGHGVNCRGAMGAGIAAQFRERYPRMYEAYRTMCNSGSAHPGMAAIYSTTREQSVVNLFSQDLPGPHARPEWITSALVSAATIIETNLAWLGDRRRFIAIPQIGCGIGGLHWNQVQSAIQRSGWDHYTVVVYTLPE